MTHDEARRLFPVLERFAYLNAGTLGPLAQPTLFAIEERTRYDQEQGRGGRAWFDSMLELRARIRQKLAALIGTTPESIALTSSTTDGCNVVVAGLTVDVYWPEWKLVVELDGEPYHRPPSAFETDRVRDATLQKIDIRVLRVTGKRMDSEPGTVLADILALRRVS